MNLTDRLIVGCTNATASAIFTDPGTWAFVIATAAAGGRSLVRPGPTRDRKRQSYRVPVYVASGFQAGRAFVAGIAQVAVGNRQGALTKFDESWYFEFDA